MKGVFALLLVVSVSLVQGAPANEKRLFLDGDCAFPAMCFVDPCMMATCASHPTATCKQGCVCTADFYLNNVKVTC